MEPFLEIQYLSDKLKELDTETDKFLDMLDATQKDVSSYSKQASSIAKSISSNLKDANNAGSSLTGTAHDLWYIYNQELNGVSNDRKPDDDLNKQRIMTRITATVMTLPSVEMIFGMVTGVAMAIMTSVAETLPSPYRTIRRAINRH